MKIDQNKEEPTRPKLTCYFALGHIPTGMPNQFLVPPEASALPAKLRRPLSMARRVVRNVPGSAYPNKGIKWGTYEA